MCFPPASEETRLIEFVRPTGVWTASHRGAWAQSRRGHALFDYFGEHHPTDEPHYYLSLWATHHDHAGRGLGTALIHDNLTHIDAQRMPAYLESTNPANLPRYEALGFRRRAEFGPVDGPLITTMWREAC
jgi:GNAT superfamily N-acetyltransferase